MSDLAILVQRANRAMNDGDYERALQTWRGIARVHTTEREVTTRGLAETYFRRGLQQGDPQQGIADLRRAIEAMPNEARYHYHEALLLHHAGQLQSAADAYWAAHELGFDPQRLAYPWALAALQADNAEHESLARQLVKDRAQQAMLEIVASFQRRQPAVLPPLSDGDDNPLIQLQVGLLHLAGEEHDEALPALQAAGGAAPLPDEAETVRRYYLGLLAAAEDDMATAQAHWRAAYEIEARRQLKQGRRLSSAADSSPWLLQNLAYVHREQAVAALAAENYKEALAQAQAGLALTADDRILGETGSLAGFYLGNQAAEAGNWQSALTYWETAYQANPSRYLALNLGLAHERLERWDEAAEYWRNMARRRPRKKSHPDYLADEQVAAVWARAAHCYGMAGKPDESVTVLRHALKYASQDPDLHLEMARAQLAAHSDGAALNTLEKLLKMEPEHVDALNLTAHTYATHGQYWVANRYWNQVLALEPNNQKAQEALCEHYEAQSTRFMQWGLFSQAMEELQQGLAVSPTNANLLGAMAVLLANQGDREGALDYARRAIEHSGAHLQGYRRAVEAATHLSDAETALVYARAALEHVPGLLPEFFVNMAVEAMRRDVEGLATPLLDLAEAAGDRMGENKAQVLARLGSLLIPGGHWQLAEQYLSRALHLDRSLAHTHLLLGMVYANTERSREARKMWRDGKKAAQKAQDWDLYETIEGMEMMHRSGIPPSTFGLMLRESLLGEFLDDIFDDF